MPADFSKHQNFDNVQLPSFDSLSKYSRETPSYFCQIRSDVIQQQIRSFRLPNQGEWLQSAIDADRLSMAQGVEVCQHFFKEIAQLVDELGRQVQMLEQLTGVNSGEEE